MAELDPSLERMRALLSSYYGVQDDTDAAVDDAKDIDCSTFDMQAHVKTLLRTEPVTGLVTTVDELDNDIKSLDVSMQNLVYENYNKFISATDTIRQMKESVTSMDERMKRLLTGMDEMTDTSSVINDALAENRGKVEKLVGVRRLLKKLEFLFELPVRLNRSIELEAYAQAVRYYNMASGVLKKYDSVPSLHAIRLEADDIISRLRVTIRESLRDERKALTDSRVVDCITLLVNLAEPRAALRDLYLRTQQRRLQEILTTFQRELTAQPELPVSRPASGSDVVASETDAAIRMLPRNDAATFVAWINEGFLDQFMAMADTFVTLFEKSCDSDVSGVEERKLAHAQLVSVTKELFGVYFSFLKRRMSFPQPEPVDASQSRFASLVKGLQQVLNDARTAGQCVREARLGDLAAEVIERIIRFQVESVFSDLRESIRGSLMKEQSDMNQGRGSFELSVPLLARGFHLQFDVALESCGPLILAGMQLQPEMARQFAGLVQGLLMQSMEWLASALEAATTPGSTTSDTPIPSVPTAAAAGSDDASAAAPVTRGGAQGILLLACAARSFEQKNLRECLDGFVRALPSRDQLSALGVDLEELHDVAVLLDEEQLAQRILTAGEHLLKHYVMLQGERLGALVKKSLSTSDWLTRKEPRDSRAVVDVLVDEVLTLRKETASALGERLVKVGDKGRRAAGGRSGGRFESGLSLTGTRGGGGGLQLDIERLFNQKQRIVGSVTFTVSSLVEGVLKVVFKTLVECIRVQTFGKHGFQQMQVDAAVLLAALPYLLESTRSGEELLNEAVASAGDRCVEAVPMERSIVQSIVDLKLTRFDF